MERLIAKGSNSLPNALCLVHGTTAFNLRQILRDDILTPKYCDVIKETVVFTFYGRPAYRISTSGQSLYETLKAPVYILLKENLFRDAITGYPFDSGAFGLELYQRFVDDELALDSFKFSPSEDAVKCLVECYFENNARYVRNSPLAIPAVEEGAFEATALGKVLARKNVDDRLDDRASTIEIGLSNNIPISNANIEAVILPQQLADSGDIGDVLKEKNIQVYFYDFVNGYSWDQYTALILSLIKTHYHQVGRL